jgi:hypothetical protein
VTSVDGGRATISLGLNSGTQTGDKFRVIRLLEGSPQDGGHLVQQVLPLEMVASEVSDTSCITTFSDLGVQVIWSETTSVLPGDVVTPRAAFASRLAMAPLMPDAPRRDVAKRLRMDNPVRYQQVARDTREAGIALAKKFQDALLRLRIPVRPYVPNEGVAEQRESLLPVGANKGDGSVRGATHVLRGTISPSRSDSHVVRLAVSPRGSTEPLDTITFGIRGDEIRDWQP